MSKIFFIADTHFGSESIRLYENRPFSNTDDMDNFIIQQWNSTVSPSDEVYHLGDFGAAGYEAEILHKLNGTKYLIKGNHDIAPSEIYRSAGFCEVYDLPVVFRKFWILSHEPLYVNTNMPYANLFGHVHGSQIYKDFSPQHYCVCVERTKYSPVDFEEIKNAVQESGRINK